MHSLCHIISTDALRVTSWQARDFNYNISPLVPLTT